MTFEQLEPTAERARRKEDCAREAFGSQCLDAMARASAQYRQTRLNLLALRSAGADDRAVPAAVDQLQQARKGPKN